MPYSVEYRGEKNCILVKVNGELSLDLLKKMASDVAAISKDHDCYCVLNDLREAKLTQKAFEVVNMPRSAQISGVARTFKRAIIVGDRTDEFKFLETVFLNQGHLVKMFSTLEEGESWLFEP